jgi:hypothetical protein
MAITDKALQNAQMAANIAGNNKLMRNPAVRKAMAAYASALRKQAREEERVLRLWRAGKLKRVK